jgi:hypothetical protein
MVERSWLRQTRDAVVAFPLAGFASDGKRRCRIGNSSLLPPGELVKYTDKHSIRSQIVKENCQSSKACTKKIVQTTQSRLSLLSKYAQSNKKKSQESLRSRRRRAFLAHFALCILTISTLGEECVRMKSRERLRDRQNTYILIRT